MLLINNTWFIHKLTVLIKKNAKIELDSWMLVEWLVNRLKLKTVTLNAVHTSPSNDFDGVYLKSRIVKKLPRSKQSSQAFKENFIALKIIITLILRLNLL